MKAPTSEPPEPLSRLNVPPVSGMKIGSVIASPKNSPYLPSSSPLGSSVNLPLGPLRLIAGPASSGPLLLPPISSRYPRQLLALPPTGTDAHPFPNLSVGNVTNGQPFTAKGWM